MSPKVEQLVPKVERESAAPPKPRTVYGILCEMFTKKDVDYAMRAAKEKRPPNLKHVKGCILDRDHLDKCRIEGGR